MGGVCDRDMGDWGVSCSAFWVGPSSYLWPWGSASWVRGSWAVSRSSAVCLAPSNEPSRATRSPCWLAVMPASAAERGFRDLKSTLLLRPVFHRYQARNVVERAIARLKQHRAIATPLRQLASTTTYLPSPPSCLVPPARTSDDPSHLGSPL